MAVSIKQRVIALVLMAVLGACSDADLMDAKSTTARAPTLAEVPDPDETVRGAGDPAIVTLDLSSSLHERRLAVSDDLPGNIIIPTTNLNAVPVTAALQAVLSGTDVSLSWNTGSFGNRLVTVMNLSGPLPKVVEKICAAAKVFCDFRHGSIELSDKETFVVALPPMAKTVSQSASSISGSGTTSSGSGSSGLSGGAAFSSSGTNSMVDAINQLIGNDKAQVDDQGGNIIYTATVEGEDRVSQYLSELRNGRPLVVLQMYIWEVTLTKENAQGINWSSFNANTIKSADLNSSNALSSVASAAGSVSIGAVTSGIISASAVVSFLATKGNVQTISNPQITFVSGTNAELKVGGTQRYISQVGTLTTSNISGTTNGSTTGNASTNTVSTDSIDTGLTIDVAGAYENGVVFANLDVVLRNLVGLNPTNSGGGTIDLPQTTDERMDTVLRVRPGDSLVLAGLVSSDDTTNTQGFPTGTDSALPLYHDSQKNNHELVMIVKPSIIQFSDKGPTAEEAKKKETAKPLPDAVVIDGDGSHSFAMPQPLAPSRPKNDIAAAAPQPELMMNDPQAASMQDVPVSSGDDQAPVDKRLMQRGFSHAFDQMLQPSDAPATVGEAP